MKYTGRKWDKSKRGNLRPKLSLTDRQVSEKELNDRMVRDTRAERSKRGRLRGCISSLSESYPRLNHTSRLTLNFRPAPRMYERVLDAAYLVVGVVG